MDRSAVARKRRQDTLPAAKYPGPVTGEKRTTQEKLKRPTSGKIRTAKDSSEFIRVPRRPEPLEKPSVGDDPNARHFTVANVGAGGKLYLKPSRLAPANFVQAPATPPDTSDGETMRTEWPGARQSNASGSWTPRHTMARLTSYDHTIPVPPLSMANTAAKRRPRSHSFSTVSERERVRSPTFDSNDFQLLINDGDRPKSSVDLSGGFLDLHIPHYRLGTPRFSDRGTAYLHSSVYTATTDGGVPSSVFSRAEYDKLFPAPPGRAHGTSVMTRDSSSQYLHPSQARYSPTPSRTPPTPPVKDQLGSGVISAAIFDKVEGNVNDPKIVRYNSRTGRIIAATPARLIAQITSPVFLDYELLSDFFLTFRSFMMCRDLLEYLLARMKWAIGTTTDAGRIVRVRTFVALRHWILNYFPDDFVLDTNFRQRFCDLVNELAHDLQQRADHAGDLNIVGELKKCWRRTCAMYWPRTDAMDVSPQADIFPCGDASSQGFAASNASLPLSLQPKASKGDFRRVSAPLQIYAEPEKAMEMDATRESTMQAFGPASRLTIRTASIPTSPASEDSLQVLSCSVPFLRHCWPSARDGDRRGAARPAGLQRNPPLSGKSSRQLQQHKRSGSFSDALRDGRAPLPSNKVDSVDVRSLPATTFTGGLVKGLLLQPSHAGVELLIPISPGLETRGVQFAGVEANYFDDRSGQHLGVRRIVGDMRRALSSRKDHDGAPTRSRSHRSTGSSGSQSSARLVQIEKSEKPEKASAWQQLRGPPRIDVLGAKIVESYKNVFQDTEMPELDVEDMEASEASRHDWEAGAPLDDRHLSPPQPHRQRNQSHVTTGSRSIVIMDDTGFTEPPKVPGALPSVSSMSSDMTPQPLFRYPDDVFKTVQQRDAHAGGVSLRPSASFAGERLPHRRDNSDLAMHDLLSMPETWRTGQDNNNVHSIAASSGPGDARKSSSVHPSGLAVSTSRNQLRRRPGGDLKAADHVHELEPAPRPHTSGSLSTISRSQATSAAHSNDLSGTHFSGQDFSAWRFPTNVGPDSKKDSATLLDSHSSQPDVRASFAAEMSTLAKLPDRSYDGGIEDTLMKLEGKRSPTDSTFTSTDREMPQLSRHGPAHGPLRVTNASISGDGSTSIDEALIVSPRTETQGASIYHLSGSEATDEMRLESSVYSDPYRRSEGQHSAAPVLPRPSEATNFPTQPPERISDKSVAFADKPENIDSADNGEKGLTRDSAPKSATTQGSFLLDDNESLSDISTEIADQSGDESLGVRSFFFDDTAEDDDHVLPRTFTAPPTPPSTVGAPGDFSPERKVNHERAHSDAHRHLKEASSAPKLLSPNVDRLRTQQQQQQLPPNPVEMRRTKTSPRPQPPAHMPFVIAFESDVIAEQLTIIEKDALDEVDWKDLIGLNWHQSPPNVRNWVDYLESEDNTGIDVVVARFNLVVKWVVSECLLTEAPSERARCITKFIHIASHCHRFRNYASMYQITLALLSADLARLHRTWSLVAPGEKQMLDRLEKLCQPLRNFQNLRSEMESSTMDHGCIPFIGLYTHDLMFNAQKPSKIEPTPPSKEPLINFERYQTAATIVKGLLRLIEASSKYIFHPHPEVLSRCLWLAALEDAEITARSKSLEQGP